MSLAPGIYEGLHEVEYFGVQSVSASLLKEMRKSPAHGFAYMNRKPEPDTDAQRLGKIIDRAILEPERLTGLAVKPEGMSFTTKDGKAWRDAHSHLEIVKYSDMATAAQIVKNVREHPVAGPLLKQKGRVQPSLFAIDPVTGLPLKARLDFLSDTNFIVDVKSTVTANPAPHGFPREIAKYGYHIQAAWYMKMAALIGISKELFIFIAVEKEAPYAVTCMQLDDESLQKGQDECTRLLRQYKHCQEAGLWPAYSDKMEVVSIPRWALSETEYESEEAYAL